jgi:hypothetical protein
MRTILYEAHHPNPDASHAYPHTSHQTETDTHDPGIYVPTDTRILTGSRTGDPAYDHAKVRDLIPSGIQGVM